MRQDADKIYLAELAHRLGVPQEEVMFQCEEYSCFFPTPSEEEQAKIDAGELDEDEVLDWDVFEGFRCTFGFTAPVMLRKAFLMSKLSCPNIREFRRRILLVAVRNMKGWDREGKNAINAD